MSSEGVNGRYHPRIIICRALNNFPTLFILSDILAKLFERVHRRGVFEKRTETRLQRRKTPCETKVLIQSRPRGCLPLTGDSSRRRSSLLYASHSLLSSLVFSFSATREPALRWARRCYRFPGVSCLLQYPRGETGSGLWAAVLSLNLLA